MEFTRSQLLEIEKIFDMYAGQNLNAFGQILEALNKMKVKPDSAIVLRILQDMSTAYDTYRTISALAHEKWAHDKDTG